MSSGIISPSARETLNSAGNAPRPAANRRRFQRAALELTGRVMASQGVDFDCRTLDVSPGDALLASPAAVRVGEQVIAYIDQIGRIAGRVARIPAPGCFAVVSSLSAHKREKLAETLTVLVNPKAAAECEVRRPGAVRYQRFGAAVLALETGEAIAVDILDFSMVGALVKAARRPLIGEWVQLGAVYGRVARYTPEGFAVDFEARGRT